MGNRRMVGSVTYQDPEEGYVIGVFGCAIWFMIGLVYFAVIGRHRLVLSPEEEFAMSGGPRGGPEAAP